MNHSEIVSFIWAVADLIRDTLIGDYAIAATAPIFSRRGIIIGV